VRVSGDSIKNSFESIFRILALLLEPSCMQRDSRKNFGTGAHHREMNLMIKAKQESLTMNSSLLVGMLEFQNCYSHNIQVIKNIGKEVRNHAEMSPLSEFLAF